MSCMRTDVKPLSPLIVKTAAFEIIEQCNFSCSFCVRNAHRKLTGKIDLATFAARLNIMKRAFPALELVAITGGEPFLHPDLVEMVKCALIAGHSVSITTNASIVDRTILREFAQSGRVYVIVSLDGPSAEIHDSVRGFPGAFARALEFASASRENGLRFGVNITVSPDNCSSVEETIRLAAHMGAADASVALVKPEGRGECNALSRMVLADVSRQVERAKDSLYGQIHIRFTEPLAHLVDVSVFAEGRRRTCGAGGDSLHIQCNGTVLLCTSSSQSLGNIDELRDEIISAWKSDNRLQSIRRDKKLAGACSECPVFDFCGGCRCRAEKAGNFLGEDPLCPRTIDPELAQAADRALEAAQRRILPSSARDPDSLKKWLLEWCSGESFDRRNNDFFSQRRWGHDYPLDSERVLKGEMGTRHIDVLRGFLSNGVLQIDLSGQRILDIGPWTGGEALLLAALGAVVDFAEEHPDYRDVTVHMAESLGLPVRCVGDSLYNLKHCPPAGYDVVYLSGIITHLSDPVIGLRIAFDRLKKGGICLIETQSSYSPDGKDEFWGGSRPGWVWWNLSRVTILEILRNVGFEAVEIVGFGKDRRIQICARKQNQNLLGMQMGLSRRGSLDTGFLMERPSPLAR